MLPNTEQDPNATDAVLEITRLRRFTGAPADFWPAFIAAAARLAGAVRGVLVLKDPVQSDRLKKLGDWSADAHADRAVLTFNQSLAELAEQAMGEGQCLQPLPSSSSPAGRAYALGIRLQLPKAEEISAAIFLLLNASEAQARDAIARVQLVADLPLSYQLNFAVQQARLDVDKFASVLDLLVLVNAEKRFLAATLAFCNGVATRYQCERVGLGWIEHGFIRLKSTSRMERFDRNMGAVKVLETAMEEAFDQDDEVLWPPPEGAVVVARDHEKFAREQESGHVGSVPVRVGGKPVAVLTCERQKEAFSMAELQQLRLLCDQAAGRLADLKKSDRWFGARWLANSREACTRLVGPEHTWAKVLSVLGFVALVLLILPIYPYRVEGKFILRSEQATFLTAPVDGYIREVRVRPGDPVRAQDVLVKLDTSDLELEEAVSVADQTRYQREAEKARAAGNLADMRISQALADQSKARLDLVRYRIEKASLRAPYDGVLIEGDLRQRIGAPIKQGDSLLRVAKTAPLYVEAEVAERDIHEILHTRHGQIAFVTQPKHKYAIDVVRIEPAAFPKEGENVFTVRCGLEQLESWWRPGMSGICKLEVERRTLLWILTHRTIDFLRMFLWW